MSSRHDERHRRRDRDERDRSTERRRSRDRRRSRSREHRRKRSRDRSRGYDRDRRHYERRRSPEEARDRDAKRDRDRDLKRDRSREKVAPVRRESGSQIEKFAAAESSSGAEYIGEVLTEEQRRKVHEEMQARLEKLQKEQPKRLVPVRPSHATIFVNDGSFLETFKQMQQQYVEQETSQTVPEPSTTDQSRQLPMFGRRRGGKILKTGIVEKKKASDSSDAPKDAWSLYLQEVKRYKSASCDADASRPLVK